MSNIPGAVRAKKRVGCGESSGHGKTSGRGTKGQYARSGHKHRAGFEGGQMTLIRRLPKRGFNHASKVVYVTINVAQLERFPAGTEVTPEVLFKAGLLNSATEPLKILGEGELSRKLVVKANGFSATAKAKIEALGGSCEVVN
jgi:large subunit ribosomal protein L15